MTNRIDRRWLLSWVLVVGCGHDAGGDAEATGQVPTQPAAGAREGADPPVAAPADAVEGTGEAEPPEAEAPELPELPQSSTLSLAFESLLAEEPPREAPAFEEPIDVRFDFGTRRKSKLWLEQRSSVTGKPGHEARAETFGPMTLSSDGSGHARLELGPLEMHGTMDLGDDEPSEHRLKQPKQTQDGIPESREDARWRHGEEMLDHLPVAPEPIAPGASVTVPREVKVGHVNRVPLVAKGKRTIRVTGAATIGGRRCARLEFEDLFDDGDERFVAAARGLGVAYYDVERRWFCALRYTSHLRVGFIAGGTLEDESSIDAFTAYGPKPARARR